MAAPQDGKVGERVRDDARIVLRYRRDISSRRVIAAHALLSARSVNHSLTFNSECI